MEIADELKQVGLKKSEIKVYLYLLEAGLSTPPQIAKGTGIARTNCYHVLRALLEKALIQEQTNRKRKAYLAHDPVAIVHSLEQKQDAAQRVVPELRELFTAKKNKPKIRFFNGWEEVKEIYRASLEAEGVVALGSTEKLYALDPTFSQWYQKELAKRKIIFTDILTAAAKEHTALEIKKVRGALHDIKFLPPAIQVATDILIWDDNVALIALEKPIFGTMLANPELANTFRAILRILWEKL